MELIVPKSILDENYTELIRDQLKLSHKHVKIGLCDVNYFMYAGILRYYFREVTKRGVAIQIYGKKFPVYARNIWLKIGSEVYVGEIEPSHDFVILMAKKS